MWEYEAPYTYVGIGIQMLQFSKIKKCVALTNGPSTSRVLSHFSRPGHHVFSPIGPLFRCNVEPVLWRRDAFASFASCTANTVLHTEGTPRPLFDRHISFGWKFHSKAVRFKTTYLKSTTLILNLRLIENFEQKMYSYNCIRRFGNFCR